MVTQGKRRINCLPFSWHHKACAKLFAEEFGDSEKDSLELLLALMLHRSDKGDIATTPELLVRETEFLIMQIEGADRTEQAKKEIQGILRKTKSLFNNNPRLFGRPEEECPIVKPSHSDGWYLLKNWRLEKKLLNNLDTLTASLPQKTTTPFPSSNSLLWAMAQIEMETGRNFSKEQKMLLSILPKQRLILLTGGPGSGKTTTIAMLLRSLCFVEKSESPLQIALAAPTGRAANRMLESLENEKMTTPCSVDERLPSAAGTLHKLLGLRDGVPAFNATNPLPFDIIIVDEASMVDLVLMNHLITALSPYAKVMLVGDPDQLPSVERGALLADFLYRSEEVTHKLHNSIVRLVTSHRSHDAVLEVAASVRNGKGKIFSALTAANDSEAVTLRPLPPIPILLREIIASYHINELHKKYPPFAIEPEIWMHKKDEIDAYFSVFSKMAILSPLRRGVLGSDILNEKIDYLLNGSGGNYHGQPIMVIANDYETDLFNGDRGVVFDFSGALYAFFPAQGGEYRWIPLSRIGAFTSSYVQTIHKSQGAEFETVTILFPAVEHNFLSREIIYTAITRAKKKVRLLGDRDVLKEGIKGSVDRYSSIRESLLPQRKSFSEPSLFDDL